MNEKIRLIDIMKDERIQCYSIMISMNTTEYLNIIEEAYENNGGIEGQRIPLKNRSAQRIRETMREDIKAGTVLPPIVIGCTMEKIDIIDNIYNNGTLLENDEIILDILKTNEISIIDGMQRTTALKEIADKDSSFKSKLRIELWVTNKANNLIYRMLVLNTGQISWTLKKQLEVVFSHIKREIEEKIPNLELIESNDGGKSNKPQKYQVSHLVELYLNFSTRKCDVKLSEKVAEEFAKQDVIEKSYNQLHLDYFISIIKKLVDLDTIFSNQNGIEKRIFGDQNARAGFVVSIASYIFGRSGRKLSDEKIMQNYEYINEALNEYIKKLNDMNTQELARYSDIELLKEIIVQFDKKELAEYYKKAFDVLIEEEFEVEDMGICWNF